jgi:hypothetical protein
LLFLNEPTDIYIHHCGHPTAIYPYYISRREDGQGPMILAVNGHGFMSLADAKVAAINLQLERQ